MENNLEFIEKNKEIIKKSWLEHYEQNSKLYDQITENWFLRVATPDGGYRVKAEWILGFLSGKHKSFSKMFYTLYLANNNLEEIINILGLNFDPRKELNIENNNKETNQNGSESTVFEDVKQKIEEFLNLN